MTLTGSGSAYDPPAGATPRDPGAPVPARTRVYGPERRLDRPVALVTGASSDVGAATARRFALDGWQLLLSGHDRYRLERTAAGTSAVVLPADLAAPDGPRLLARSALHRTGRIDALVAGAGIGWAGPFAAMPHTDIDRVLTLNLNATLHLVREVLPTMIAAGRGRVVLLDALQRPGDLRQEAVYAAAKAGLAAFAEALREELRGTGVGVTRVAPGPADGSHAGLPSPGHVAGTIFDAVRRHEDEAYLRPPPGTRTGEPGPGLLRRLRDRLG
ncbi:SDR family NAD(P)-dependent oxidoreductase [Streptomyces sp. DT190]|uniref:SDR family NAD(P)-dependent oxidoreductase n=1 Tax=unclassified Streptomyces TaxID=2593676 RepID=UPI003CECE08D